MPEPLSLAEHTLLAELIEKSLDGMFDDQFPENGSFSIRTIKNRDGVDQDFFYYQGYRPKGSAPEGPVRYQKYVGPVDDPAIAARVQQFREIKAGRKERANLVQALAGIGLPHPPVQMGRVVEALAKAGLFRMRAVLVGTVAYQTYPAVLGMRLDESIALTGDVDVAQFRSISIGIDDRSEPILDVLKRVDPTFHAVPHPSDRIAATAFQNARGFRLEFLTPHRGSDDQMGKPLKMDALSGAAADPLRFLDFLIYKPIRSVLLFGSGVSVNVPAPERFAIHKLIVSQRRRTDAVGIAKSRKDISQADQLILALDQISQRQSLTDAFLEAWERGPVWRECLERGARRLPSGTQEVLAAASEGAFSVIPGAAKAAPSKRKQPTVPKKGRGIAD